MGLLVQADMATPVINDLGTKEQKAEFLTPAIRGDKIAALGVSEPNAGSDVAGIQTSAQEGRRRLRHHGLQDLHHERHARRLRDAARRRRDPEQGAHGCSFFLVPTRTKGFHVSKKLKKIGNHSSDTAELHFEDMRVPKRYLLGEENMGFMYLMQNFQSERHHRLRQRVRGRAVMIDEAIAYGRDRKAFGKPIIKREYWQQKFVDLTAKLEAAQRAHLQRRRGVQRGQVRQEGQRLASTR